MTMMSMTQTQQKMRTLAGRLRQKVTMKQQMQQALAAARLQQRCGSSGVGQQQQQMQQMQAAMVKQMLKWQKKIGRSGTCV
jgi:hypothetical protein